MKKMSKDTYYTLTLYTLVIHKFNKHAGKELRDLHPRGKVSIPADWVQRYFIQFLTLLQFDYALPQVQTAQHWSFPVRNCKPTSSLHSCHHLTQE